MRIDASDPSNPHDVMDTWHRSMESLALVEPMAPREAITTGDGTAYRRRHSHHSLETPSIGLVPGNRAQEDAEVGTLSAFVYLKNCTFSGGANK
jgi:hypothetical protein